MEFKFIMKIFKTIKNNESQITTNLINLTTGI